jgi:uncharacterized HAD superfamily protein
VFAFSDLHRLIQANLSSIDPTTDLIVVIPRSGYVPAGHIATVLNLPIISLDRFSSVLEVDNRFTLRSLLIPKSNPKNILVVDDTTCTGSRMNNAVELVSRKWPKSRITTLSIAVASNFNFRPDIYFFESPAPRMFAWNMFNHSQLTKHLAVDLDGILCDDPNQEQNDDGTNYLDFIGSARIKVRPQEKVKAIVTGRLEKYREQTENWLQKNDIHYTDLFMNDAPSALYRRTEKFISTGLEVDQISHFKSRILQEIKPNAFIESNLVQASNIHKITGINTYAFDDDKFFGSSKFEF